jgi:hypothetical protein
MKKQSSTYRCANKLPLGGIEKVELRGTLRNVTPLGRLVLFSGFCVSRHSRNRGQACTVSHQFSRSIDSMETFTVLKKFAQQSIERRGVVGNEPQARFTDNLA